MHQSASPLSCPLRPRLAMTRSTTPNGRDVSAVGFEPTSANTVELESTPLDRSGTLTINSPRMPQLTNQPMQLFVRCYVPSPCPKTALNAPIGITAFLTFWNAFGHDSEHHSNNRECQCQRWDLNPRVRTQ